MVVKCLEFRSVAVGVLDWLGEVVSGQAVGGDVVLGIF